MDDKGIKIVTKTPALATNSEKTTGIQATNLPTDNAEKERGTRSKTLLHIGYAKAGSTFLQNWFVGHPQIQYARHGVGGFEKVYELIALAVEDREQLPKYFVTSRETLGMAWLNTHGSGGLMLKRQYYQTASVMEKHQTNVCKILYNLFPNSRVLIMTRGYQGIIRSGYSEYVKIGGDQNFSGYLESFHSYFEQWLDINYIVNLYGTFFGKTNLLVIPYELLRDDPKGLLALMEKELDVDHYEMDIRRINASRTRAELYWYSKISRLFISPLAERLSDKRVAALYQKYRLGIVHPNRLRRVIKILDHLFNTKADLDCFPPGYLDAFKDKATVLKEYPLYANYLSEYLLD